MRRRGTPVSREALYEAVWTDAVTLVAPRYGLSDVGLVKICKKLGIPVPPRGYWAKIKAGRPTHKLQLPSLTAGARGSGALEAARRLGSSGRREKRAQGSARPAVNEAHSPCRRQHDADDLDRRAGHANQPHADPLRGAGARPILRLLSRGCPGRVSEHPAVRLAPHWTPDSHGGIVAVTEVERHGTQPHRLATERHRRCHRRPGRSETRERRRRGAPPSDLRGSARPIRNASPRAR